MKMMHQMRNLSKKIEILKKNQMVFIDLQMTTLKLKIYWMGSIIQRLISLSATLLFLSESVGKVIGILRIQLKRNWFRDTFS